MFPRGIHTKVNIFRVRLDVKVRKLLFQSKRKHRGAARFMFPRGVEELGLYAKVNIFKVRLDVRVRYSFIQSKRKQRGGDVKVSYLFKVNVSTEEE